MSRSFFKFAVALCAFSAINAFSDDAQVRNLENRVSALEQRKGSNSMILPPAGANLSNDAGIMFDVEFLLLRPQVAGLALGQYENIGTTQLTNVIQPGWKLDPGFRVKFGFRPGHDAWQVNAAWTYLHSRFSTSVATPSGVEIANGFDLATTRSTGLAAHWRSNLNIGDLDVSRDFYVSKHLAIRPSLGLRSAWVYQSYYTNYTGAGAIGSNATGSHIFNTNISNNVWGFGPKAAVDTCWCLGSGVSIFGEAGISALWSLVKVNEVQVQDAVTTTKSQRNLYHTVVPEVDAALGLAWDKNFDEDQYHFGLSAAWEFHSFFNMDQFETLHTTYGNFSLQGLRIAATFDF